MDTHSAGKEKLAAAETKMVFWTRYVKNRKTNVWVREKAKVIDVIDQDKRQKWAYLGMSHQ